MNERSAIAELMNFRAPKRLQGRSLADPDEPGITAKQRANRRYYLKHGPRKPDNLRREVQWVPVSKELPDDEMTVLMVVDGEPWTGFHAEGQWHYVTADICTGAVTHWCEFPEVPDAAI